MFNNSFIFILNLSTQEFYNIRIFSEMNSLWVLLHFEERSVALWTEVLSVVLRTMTVVRSVALCQKYEMLSNALQPEVCVAASN